WNAERMFIGGGTSTRGGSGIVNVNGGGALNAANLGRIGVWGTGTINLSGGRIQTGSVQFSGGAFNWTSGEVQISEEPGVVDAGGMLGNDVAIGAGKVLLVPELRVGSTGAGTLAAAGGGSISATDLFVGHGSYAAGTVAVSGAGTRLDAGSLAVGLAGTGNVL